MGLGTVFGTLAFGFIFAGMVVFATVIQHNMATAATEQQELQRQQALEASTEITIDSAAFQSDGYVQYMDTLYRDFDGGQADNTTLMREGGVILSGPAYQNGTYISKIYDSGYATTQYGGIGWNGISPLGTNITVQLRTANTVAGLEAAQFLGPDATTNTHYSSMSMVNETYNTSRYIQYKAYLNTNDTTKTPELYMLFIDVYKPVDTAIVYVNNTGNTPLDPEKTDVYFNGQRVERNTTQRMILHIDTGEQALWNKGEQLAIYLSRDENGAGTDTIRVANGPATDVITV